MFLLSSCVHGHGDRVLARGRPGSSAANHDNRLGWGKGACEMQSDVKVLLVEDDADYAEIYRLRLETDGYDVMVAPDGEAALEMVQRVVPDLVYLDLRMPRLDGFSMLSALRADPATAHVPVIVLSNYDAPELRPQGME